jgi:hypothetical protein
MSDTPETDAVVVETHLGDAVDADHARKLERERDEARRWNEEGKANGHRVAVERDQLQRERDEARALAEQLRNTSCALSFYLGNNQ